MSSLSDAITAMIIAQADPGRAADARITAQFMASQKSPLQMHMESGCDLCKASPEGKCFLAVKLEQLFDKVFLT